MKYCFFSINDEVPNLESDKIHTIVFPPEDFLLAIQKNRNAIGGNKLTSPNILRNIIATIISTYCEKPEFNVYTSFPVQNYVGIPFSNDQDIFQVLIRIFNAHFPEIYDRYLAYKIKQAPKGTTLIYIVNAPLRVEKVMTKLGIEKLTPAFVKDYIEDIHYKKGNEVGAYFPTKQALEEHKKMLENKLVSSIEMEDQIAKIQEELIQHNPEFKAQVEKINQAREKNMPKPLKESLNEKRSKSQTREESTSQAKS
jgi:hypothetical protein